MDYNKRLDDNLQPSVDYKLKWILSELQKISDLPKDDMNDGLFNYQINSAAPDQFPFYSSKRTHWMEFQDRRFQSARAVEYEGKRCVEIKMAFTDPK